jgi:hypothetical protein
VKGYVPDSDPTKPNGGRPLVLIWNRRYGYWASSNFRSWGDAHRAGYKARLVDLSEVGA